MSSRVASITGLGAVTTLGPGAAALGRGLFEGRSGIGRLHDVDPRVLARIGADLTGLSAASFLAEVGLDVPDVLRDRALKLLRATPLSGVATACAGIEAWVDAGLGDADVDATRVAHVLGGHNLSLRYQFDNHETFREEPDFIEPLFGLMALDTDVLAVTSEILGIRGPTLTVGGACASSNAAIVVALDLLRAGRADVALVTGACMDLDSVWLQGWVILEAVSFRSFADTPEKASRPFDRRREGFVPAEAAGAIVLETREHAERRRARARATLHGGASTSGATRSTRPDFESQVAAIEGALIDAGLKVDDVDLVSAHATSTPLGDTVEVAALERALGARVRAIPVNAPKSMLGHSLTSASMIECVATVLQLEAQRVHPTINLDEPDPELTLDFVREGARDTPLRHALSNAFGFGGINTSIVLGVP
ncbi:MAG: polyketide beta-ketoacyl:ACP synthase [Sandaracinus sp.]|nr:polyketide beta-ketoacyl:ACP synthase [Sandaracinus sp.]MCB9615897.1 polyketide beta-ketoacyl:ACP synthase [Sandaracinus sp.]MCB9624388.1 polyketide beta-ketoacyl:ACP synthase [Sandaracinus sp.]